MKKDVKSKVAAKNGCDDRLIAKILINNNNSAEFVLPLHVSLRLGTNSPELLFF